MADREQFEIIMYQKLLFFSFILMTLLFVNTIIFAETITVTTGEWGPWAGKKRFQKGFVCHIIQEAFGRNGYKVKFSFYPWKRAYILLVKGKVDASAYWFPSEERKKMCLYSDVVTQEKVVFFHLKGKPMKDWEKLEDLKGYKIGVSLGHTYTDHFWVLGRQKLLNFELVNNDLINLKKLIYKRIDIFPAALVMGLDIIRTRMNTSFEDQITYHPKPFRVTTGHLIFKKDRKHSKKYLKIFNEGLKELKNDGTYDTYMNDLISGKYSK